MTDWTLMYSPKEVDQRQKRKRSLERKAHLALKAKHPAEMSWQDIHKLKQWHEVPTMLEIFRAEGAGEVGGG